MKFHILFILLTAWAIETKLNCSSDIIDKMSIEALQYTPNECEDSLYSLRLLSEGFKIELRYLSFLALNSVNLKDARKFHSEMENLVNNLVKEFNIYIIKDNHVEYNRLWENIIEPLQDLNNELYEALRLKFGI